MSRNSTMNRPQRRRRTRALQRPQRTRARKQRGLKCSHNGGLEKRRRTVRRRNCRTVKLVGGMPELLDNPVNLSLQIGERGKPQDVTVQLIDDKTKLQAKII